MNDRAGLSEEAVEDVMSTLRLIARWRLGSEGWDEVLVCLHRLSDAMARGEKAAVYAALDDVERLGPSRLASIARSGSASRHEDSDRLVPPEPVMEILNMLIHPADGWGRPHGGATPGPG